MISPYTGGARLWLTAAIVVILLLCALSAFSLTVFQTNDDNAIVLAAAGYQTGAPYAGTVYTTYLYGLMLSWLYGLMPCVPWHGALMYAAMAISLTALLKSMLAASRELYGGVTAGLMTFLGLFFGVCAQYAVKLQFTTVPALMAISACALIISGGNKPSRAENALAACLMPLACAMRAQAFLLCAPLIAIALVWLMIERAGARRRAAGFFALLSLLCAYAMWGDGLLYGARQPEWREYQAYSDASSELMDYASSGAARFAEAGESAGWSSELSGLVANWYFLDERINTASMLKAAQALDDGKEAFSLYAMLKAVGSILKRYVIFGVNLIFLAASLAALALSRRARGLTTALAFGAYLFAVIAYFYYIRGRFPDRVAFAAAFGVYALPPLLLAIKPAVNAARARRAALCVGAAALICGAVTLSFNWKSCVVQRNASPRIAQMQLSDRVNRYVAQRKDTVYVTEMAQNFGPFRVYEPGQTQNLVQWSSGLVESPLYKAQLRSLGYGEFHAAQFYDERVRLLLSGEEQLHALLAYLNADYGPTRAETVDVQDGFCVYRLLYGS